MDEMELMNQTLLKKTKDNQHLAEENKKLAASLVELDKLRVKNAQLVQEYDKLKLTTSTILNEIEELKLNISDNFEGAKTRPSSIVGSFTAIN